MKKTIWPIFLILPTMADNDDILLVSKRCFDNFGASYKIISLTPKILLKSQKFDKKCYSSNRKIIRLIFSRIVEFDEPHKKTYKCSNDFLIINMEVVRSFL